MYKKLIALAEKEDLPVSDSVFVEIYRAVCQNLAQSPPEVIQACARIVTTLSETNDGLQRMLAYNNAKILPKIIEALNLLKTQKNISAVEDILEIIHVIVESTAKESYGCQMIVPSLLEFIILPSWSFTMQLESAKLLNLLLEKHSDLQAKFPPAFTKFLKCFGSGLLRQLGDYELQATIMEAVFRIITPLEKKSLAVTWFPVEQICNAFMAVRNEEFETDCRRFLNFFNSYLPKEQKVYSFPILGISLGRYQLKRPNDIRITDFWLDFNTHSSSISTFVNDDSEEGGNGDWEMVSIKKEAIKDFRVNATDEKTILILKLYEPAHTLAPFCPESSQQYVKILFPNNQKIAIAVEKLLGQIKYVDIPVKSPCVNSPRQLTRGSQAISPLTVHSLVLSISANNKELSDQTVSSTSDVIKKTNWVVESPIFKVDTPLQKQNPDQRKDKLKKKSFESPILKGDNPTEEKKTDHKVADKGKNTTDKNFNAAEAEVLSATTDEQNLDQIYQNEQKYGKEVNFKDRNYLDNDSENAEVDIKNTDQNENIISKISKEKKNSVETMKEDKKRSKKQKKAVANNDKKDNKNKQDILKFRDEKSRESDFSKNIIDDEKEQATTKEAAEELETEPEEELQKVKTLIMVPESQDIPAVSVKKEKGEEVKEESDRKEEKHPSDTVDKSVSGDRSGQSKRCHEEPVDFSIVKKMPLKKGRKLLKESHDLFQSSPDPNYIAPPVRNPIVEKSRKPSTKETQHVSLKGADVGKKDLAAYDFEEEGENKEWEPSKKQSKKKQKHEPKKENTPNEKVAKKSRTSRLKKVIYKEISSDHEEEPEVKEVIEKKSSVKKNGLVQQEKSVTFISPVEETQYYEVQDEYRESQDSQINNKNLKKEEHDSKQKKAAGKSKATKNKKECYLSPGSSSHRSAKGHKTSPLVSIMGESGCIIPIGVSGSTKEDDKTSLINKAKHLFKKRCDKDVKSSYDFEGETTNTALERSSQLFTPWWEKKKKCNKPRVTKVYKPRLKQQESTTSSDSESSQERLERMLLADSQQLQDEQKDEDFSQEENKHCKLKTVSEKNSKKNLTQPKKVSKEKPKKQCKKATSNKQYAMKKTRHVVNLIEVSDLESSSQESNVPMIKRQNEDQKCGAAKSPEKKRLKVERALFKGKAGYERKMKEKENLVNEEEDEIPEQQVSSPEPSDSQLSNQIETLVQICKDERQIEQEIPCEETPMQENADRKKVVPYDETPMRSQEISNENDRSVKLSQQSDKQQEEKEEKLLASSQEEERSSLSSSAEQVKFLDETPSTTTTHSWVKSLNQVFDQIQSKQAHQVKKKLYKSPVVKIQDNNSRSADDTNKKRYVKTPYAQKRKTTTIYTPQTPASTKLSQTSTPDTAPVMEQVQDFASFCKTMLEQSKMCSPDITSPQITSPLPEKSSMLEKNDDTFKTENKKADVSIMSSDYEIDVTPAEDERTPLKRKLVLPDVLGTNKRSAIQTEDLDPLFNRLYKLTSKKLNTYWEDERTSRQGMVEEFVKECSGELSQWYTECQLKEKRVKKMLEGLASMMQEHADDEKKRVKGLAQIHKKYEEEQLKFISHDQRKQAQLQKEIRNEIKTLREQLSETKRDTEISGIRRSLQAMLKNV